MHNVTRVNCRRFASMPRTLLTAPKGSPSPRTARRKTWDKQAMISGIVAVREKSMGLKKAAKHFSVPKTTLQRFVNQTEFSAEELVEKKLGRKPVLSDYLEKQLVQYLLLMESKYHGLTRRDVKVMAFQLAERNNLKHPFGAKEEAGRAWLDHFLRRHQDKLSIRKPTGTSISRANGFNRESVNKFFDLLENEYEKHKFTADRVFNVDETGLSIVQTKIPQIIGMKGKRQIGALTAAERGSTMTVICCMSAGGRFIPPMLIFPRKNMSDNLMRNAPLGSIGKCHPSGWVQSNLFRDWFLHFIDHVKPSAESPVLLFLDGHYSHTRNIEIIELARQNHVTIVSLPPHTTHKLQPLDKTFMGALKTHYSEAIRLWMRHNQRRLGPYDIAELFNQAYVQCQTGSIAINGFSNTGLFPCNRHMFTDADFIAAEQQGEPPTDASIGNENLAQAVCSSSPDSNSSSQIILPVDITPVPQPKRKMSNRGRKASSAAVITSSPYKSELEESAKKRKITPINCRLNQEQNSTPSTSHGKVGPTKKASKIKRPTKSKSKKNDQSESSEEGDDISVVSDSSNDPEIYLGKKPNSNDDAICVFCDGKFSEDRKGELWVQCMMCEMWAHCDCADCEKDNYVCDFCR